MDSLTQMALGAAVGVAVMGRRTAVWKSALWGAVAGTLPDLDVLIDQGDAVRNMVLHRAQTHALFWLTLFSLPLAAAVARLHRQQALWRRWWLALWLVLLTHPLLDAMTVYGTQLALPFSNHPFGVGSIFIIDPAYTLPLLVGVGWALAGRGSGRALRVNLAGLLLSSACLGLGVWAQQHVATIARNTLAQQGIVPDRLLVTPAPLQGLLWRVVAVQDGAYHEGFRSLLDAGPGMRFDRFDRGSALWPQVQQIGSAQRIAAFSHGFWKLHAEDGLLRITDLRMGQEPAYVFSFALAQQQGGTWVALPQPQQLGARIDVRRGLAWLGPRMLGQQLPSPR